MNGSSAVNYPPSEQFIGKFHVDKVSLHQADETTIGQPVVSIADESICASRFQMIRVDRNFGRGRWKVNDYEPPENASTSTLPLVNAVDNEQCSLINTATGIPAELNITPSATLPSNSAAAAVFQQQQQRLTLGNTPLVLSTGNVPSPAGLLHAYPPGSLTNLAASNQPYLLPNHHHHHQFGYYPFYPHPYSPYAAQWAALLGAHPYSAPPTIASTQLPSGNPNDPLRLTETEMTNDNAVMPSNDHLQTAPSAATPFLYAAHHSPFVPQLGAGAASPYATIPSYHPAPSLPTIIPPNQPPQSLTLSQFIANYPADLSHAYQLSFQQAPNLTSPKHETTKALTQSSLSTATPKGKPSMAPSNIADLISSSPSLNNAQQAPVSLISPIATMSSTGVHPTAASLNDLWTYPSVGTPLDSTRSAMGLLGHETNPTTEIANEILKELNTPTKQNNTTDIDNKISAAMDLVKMHLLSAVREEVTELREQIRTLKEKVNSIEHENLFLRQHVSSEIYAQYMPTLLVPSVMESGHLSAVTAPSLSSSQSIPMTPLPSLPSSTVQQSTTAQPPSLSANPSAN